jgi:hypothetical protein
MHQAHGEHEDGADEHDQEAPHDRSPRAAMLTKASVPLPMMM